MGLGVGGAGIGSREEGIWERGAGCGGMIRCAVVARVRMMVMVAMRNPGSMLAFLGGVMIGAMV